MARCYCLWFMLGQFGVLLLFRVLCNTCANFSAVSLTAKLPEHACLPLVLKTQRFHFVLSLVSCLHITLHYNRKILQKPGGGVGWKSTYSVV